MATYKRTSKKTGNTSRRTVTLSTKGRTDSYSNKPSKNASRRTISFNHKTGRTRTTHTTKLGGGWTRVTSKTTGGTKTKKSSKNSGGNVDFSLSLPLWITIIVLGTIMYLWPITVPYILIPIGSIVGLFVLVWLFFTVLPYAIVGLSLYGLYKLLEFIL